MRACLALAVSFCLVPTAVAADLRRTVQFDFGGQHIEGTPLTSSSAGVELLGRDGRLWTVPAQAAKSLKQTSSSFQSYPVSVLKGRLQTELGKGFRVVSTGHYLVAYPEKVRANWAARFEELYRSFELYFSVRGFRLQDPEFPLIAIVWPDRQSFARACAADRGIGSVPTGLLGYYSPVSNRIMLYDMGNGRASDEAWEQTGATIIHEATHQTAFNTGIHRRFADTPRWVVEGLGMMFEAPGVWNSRAYTRREDRINHDRLDYFRERLVPRHKPEILESLVGSDRLFTSDILSAYAEAWALSFYLVETQPRKYSQYLAVTAQRPVGQAYVPAKRLADFTAVFGANFRMLEAQLLRFMADLP
ncbi:MAG TPA: DUF1570 domain-containing protein [Pirellulales bacterium]|nr:DUF1570 domain-containing protein [Pirellulales bacterium]